MSPIARGTHDEHTTAGGARSGIRLSTTREDIDVTESINAKTPGRLAFDEDGDIDRQTMDDLVDAIRADGTTDLVVFSHGWNNDEAAARSLYGRWFELLAAQVDPGRKIGYVGVRWPAQLWRDEPIPDFDATAAVDHGGAAGRDETTVIEAGSPTIDPAQLADLKEMFPNGSEQLETIAGLLAQPPAPGRATELFTAMREFSSAVGVKSNDGEAEKVSKVPGMLDRKQDPDDVFTTFADRLAEAGVEFGDGGVEAGLGDFASKVLHGAKEALRQLTYWQMKNRAGVIGQKGLGPALDGLADESPTCASTSSGTASELAWCPSRWPESVSRRHLKSSR
jgi:hypothetical protein